MYFFYMPSIVYSLWYDFFMSFQKSQKNKVTHRNAKFKVTRKTTKEDVYYSNAPDKDKAKEEGYRAFGIYKEGIKSSITSMGVEVEENPHRMVDDDGYDTVTGIKYQ